MDEIKYSVVSDFKTVQEEFADLSPYNIIKDCKELSIKENDYYQIANEIADELANGAGRPANIDLYISKNGKASFAKVKIIDIKTNKGKSSGYRCIVLNDRINRIGYLLHIYKHSQGIDNISDKEKNSLKKLTEDYVSSFGRV